MSAKNPFDPLGVGAMSMDVWRAMMTSPAQLLEAQLEFGKALSQPPPVLVAAVTPEIVKVP